MVDSVESQAGSELQGGARLAFLWGGPPADPGAEASGDGDQAWTRVAVAHARAADSETNGLVSHVSGATATGARPHRGRDREGDRRRDRERSRSSDRGEHDSGHSTIGGGWGGRGGRGDSRGYCPRSY